MTPVYKIRDCSGKFSTGGRWPRFTRLGKCWNTLGHIRAHVRQTYSKHRETYDHDSWRGVREVPTADGLEVVDITTGEVVTTVAKLLEEMS